MTQPQPLDLDAIEAVIRNAAVLGADIAPETAAAMAAEIRRLRAELAAANARLDATARLAGRQETKLRELGAPATVDAMDVTSDDDRSAAVDRAARP